MPTIRTFGPFRLDTEAEILFRGAEPVDLGRRAVALLCALTERPGAVVSKDALIEAAWSDVAVEESNLTVQISALRRALGGDGWIETLPRRGYRFVGLAVTPEENVGAATAAERRQLTVMSCELVGAGVQSSGMDLEDFWSVMGTYQGNVVDTAGRFGESSASISAIPCWSISAIRRRMRTMPSGRCTPGSTCARPWALSRRVAASP